MRPPIARRPLIVPRLARLGRLLPVLALLLLTALLVHTIRRALQPAPRQPVSWLSPERHAILTIHADGRWTLNGQLVPSDAFETELARVFARRPVKVLFVTAAPTRTHDEITAVGARARAAGIASVGYLPPLSRRPLQ